MRAEECIVLMPVKPPAVGKSRLAGLPDDVRRELAAAFALDTAAACLAAGVGGVLGVTDDAHFSRRLSDLGCSVIPDGIVGDLNGCLRLAAAEAARRCPALTPAAVCADLPALRPDHLSDALAATDGAGPAFVADAHGTGTTLYVAAVRAFAPAFGPESRAAHLASGATEIHADALTTLRHDVDDLADLERAFGLGVGPHTAGLRESLDLTPSERDG